MPPKVLSMRRQSGNVKPAQFTQRKCTHLASPLVTAALDDTSEALLIQKRYRLRSHRNTCCYSRATVFDFATFIALVYYLSHRALRTTPP